MDISDKSPEELLEEALETTEQADVIVAVVGEASEMTGESASRTDITIPDSQKKLIKALVKTGKPVVLVLMSGRPLVISEEMKLPVSILQIRNPGIEAGNAVADVVFGNYNPSGKLTASWPRNVGQIPVYYAEKSTGRPLPTKDFQKFKSDYIDSPNSPLLPFGYGLSYTSFNYSNVHAHKKTFAEDGKITLSATITNTGDYDGEEVVQLYIHDKVRSITPPVKELKGFKKIALNKGESREVSFEITPEDLKFYNKDLDYVFEPGEFEFFIAGSSDHAFEGDFTLE